MRTFGSYDWLVVAGSKAQYRGDATVNGAAGYRFLLTAYDDSPDRIRLKVWDASNVVVYDNRRGAPDDVAGAVHLLDGPGAPGSRGCCRGEEKERAARREAFTQPARHWQG